MAKTKTLEPQIEHAMCTQKNILKDTVFKQACKKNNFIDDSRIEMMTAVTTLCKELEAGKAAHLKKYNLSEGRLLVLMSLWHSDAPLKATEIAESLGVTRATMTGLIDSLVEDGFVDKQDSATDRRIFSLALSKKGNQFMQKLLPDHFQRIRQFSEILSKEESCQLTTLVNKLIKGIRCFKD